MSKSAHWFCTLLRKKNAGANTPSRKTKVWCSATMCRLEQRSLSRWGHHQARLHRLPCRTFPENKHYSSRWRHGAAAPSPTAEITTTFQLFKVWITYACMYVCISKEKEGEGEGEEHWCVRKTLISCLSHTPRWRTEPTTQACALTGNWTSDLVLCGKTQPAEPHWSGPSSDFLFDLLATLIQVQYVQPTDRVPGIILWRCLT